MKVSELNAGQGKVDVVVEVKSVEVPRVFNKYGRDLRVANAVVSDESGEIKMTLWNNDIDKVKVGDTIKVTNGYVSEFQGEKQLTSGKFGSLEVVGKGGGNVDSVGGDAGDSSPPARPEEGEDISDTGKEVKKAGRAKKVKEDSEEEEVSEEVSEEEMVM